MGCFERVYSAQHMRENPRQSVRRLTIEIEKSRYGYPQIDFGMDVWVRDAAGFSLPESSAAPQPL
jgi:hypothetical protein